MTLAMPDSIRPGDLPPGYPAYLGYADGRWPTAPVLRQKFPGAHVLSLTPTGATLDADGIDCEPGNPNAVDATDWVARKLAIAAASRPVVYADLASPGYSMTEIVERLSRMGIGRTRYRVHTAHYTYTEHICSAATRACRDASGNPISFTADATQWTNRYPGLNGSIIDMSAVSDGYFGIQLPAPAAYTWTEFDMAKLPVLKQGAADHPGAFFYVRRLQQLVLLTGTLNALPAASIAVDGDYGPKTTAGVKAVQAHYGISQDGVAGAQTWSVLLTGGALWAREAYRAAASAHAARPPNPNGHAPVARTPPAASAAITNRTHAANSSSFETVSVMPLLLPAARASIRRGRRARWRNQLPVRLVAGTAPVIGEQPEAKRPRRPEDRLPGVQAEIAQPPL